MTHEAARDDHLTVDERRARGKAARAEVPRSAHATWEPSRTGPIRSSCSVAVRDERRTQEQGRRRDCAGVYSD